VRRSRQFSLQIVLQVGRSWASVSTSALLPGRCPARRKLREKELLGHFDTPTSSTKMHDREAGDMLLLFRPGERSFLPLHPLLGSV